MKYMASECENEQIVIEESLRESFFDFIDASAQAVFGDVFNNWAQKISGSDKAEVGGVRERLMSAFYEWIKLKLPTEVVR